MNTRNKKVAYILSSVIALSVYYCISVFSGIQQKNISTFELIPQFASVPKIQLTESFPQNVPNLDLNNSDYLVASVIKVVDGDTLSVSLDSKNTKVRLIGINTPETVDPRKGVECFGKEASNKVKEILKKGTIIYIQTDDSQQKYDSFGRLLGYVFLQDGRLLNQMLIEEGYAYEYTYKHPYVYSIEFKKAENSAKNKKVGLWADGACL